MAGLLSGYVGDDTVKDEYGMTQADRREPIWSGLIKAGLLGVAAGGNIMPGQRAQLIGQMGGAFADIPKGMQEAAAAGAQQKLRGQQLDEGKRKVADRDRVRAYAQTPEFQEMIKDASGPNRLAIQAAVDAGDIAALNAAVGNLDKTAIGLARSEAALAKVEAAKAAADAKAGRYKGSNERLQHLDDLQHEPPDSQKYWAAWDYLMKDQRAPDGTIIPKTDLKAAGFKEPTFVPPGGKPPPPPTDPNAPKPPVVVAPDAPVTPEVAQSIAAEMKVGEEREVNGVVFRKDREGRTEYDTGTDRYRIGSDGKTIAQLPALKPPDASAVKVTGNLTKIAKVDETLAEMARLPQAILGAWAAAPDAYLQRKDPEGQNIRDLIQDLSGMEIHDRSGTAVSAAELDKLGFLPKKTDTPQVIKRRLENMKKWADAETRAYYESHHRDFRLPDEFKQRYGRKPAAAAGPKKQKLVQDPNAPPGTMMWVDE